MSRFWPAHEAHCGHRLRPAQHRLHKEIEEKKEAQAKAEAAEAEKDQTTQGVMTTKQAKKTEVK